MKPGRLTTGIPKPERILGVSCMIAPTLTGLYLTWYRMDRWEHFFDNSFGLYLFVKLCLFTTMVLIALTAITVIHRKMRQTSMAGAVPENSNSADPGDLRRFHGLEGRPAHIRYEDRIIDVSESDKWQEGRRARMGTAMMAPDYAWWHGFYELKHRYVKIVEAAERLEAGEKPRVFRSLPGRFDGP